MYETNNCGILFHVKKAKQLPTQQDQNPVRVRSGLSSAYIHTFPSLASTLACKIKSKQTHISPELSTQHKSSCLGFVVDAWSTSWREWIRTVRLHLAACRRLVFPEHPLWNHMNCPQFPGNQFALPVRNMYVIQDSSLRKGSSYNRMLAWARWPIHHHARHWRLTAKIWAIWLYVYSSHPLFALSTERYWLRNCSGHLGLAVSSASSIPSYKVKIPFSSA